MAKIFAVVKNEKDELELVAWSSAKTFFEEGNSFTDDRFIYIAATDDYKKEGLFREPKEHVDPDAPVCSLRITETTESINAYNMVHYALKKHFRGKVFDVPNHYIK